MLSWKHTCELLQGQERDVIEPDQEIAKERALLERCSTVWKKKEREDWLERLCRIQQKSQDQIEHYGLRLHECNRAIIEDNVGQGVVTDVS